MSSSVDIQAAQAWCADFVAQRPSNVTRLAGLLPAAKRPLFYPAYCAMRVIDDEVDDVFLALADSRRDAERPGVARRVEQWRNDAVESLQGRYVTTDDTDDARIFVAMNATLGRSNMGTDAFHGLANAMQRDVAERPLAMWDEFLDYTEGAAVAPAAVFVFILAAKVKRDGTLTCQFEQTLCGLCPPSRDLQLPCAYSARSQGRCGTRAPAPDPAG